MTYTDHAPELEARASELYLCPCCDTDLDAPGAGCPACDDAPLEDLIAFEPCPVVDFDPPSELYTADDLAGAVALGILFTTLAAWLGVLS